MKKPKKIEFNLGQPIAGWLPVYFKSGDFILDFTSSKTPESPTDQLCSGLILILNGVETEICWTEEPVCYFFKFIPKEDIYTLTIEKTDSNGHKRTEIYSGEGKMDMVLPFYRALKRWTTLEFDSSAWNKIDQAKLDKLTCLVKKIKTV